MSTTQTKKKSIKKSEAYTQNSKIILRKFLRYYSLVSRKNTSSSCTMEEISTKKKKENLKGIFASLPLDVVIGNVFPFISYFELLTSFCCISKEWYLSIWEKYIMNSSISRLLLNFSRSLKRSFNFGKLGGKYDKFPILLPTYDDHIMCDTNRGFVKYEPVVLIGEGCEQKLCKLQNFTRSCKYLSDLKFDPLSSLRETGVPREKLLIYQDSEILSPDLHTVEFFRKHVTNNLRGAAKSYSNKSNVNIPQASFSIPEVFIDALLSNKSQLSDYFFTDELKKEIRNLNVVDADQNKACMGVVVWILREILSFYFMMFEYRLFSTKYANTHIPNNDSPSNIKISMREKRLSLFNFEGSHHFKEGSILDCFSQVIDTIYGMNILNAST